MNEKKTEACPEQLDHFPTQSQTLPRDQQKSYKSKEYRGLSHRLWIRMSMLCNQHVHKYTYLYVVEPVTPEPVTPEPLAHLSVSMFLLEVDRE